MDIFEGVERRYYTEVWRKYLFAKGLDDVPRIGFVLCGTGRVQPLDLDERRARRERIAELENALAELGVVRLETDGGHTYGLSLLVDLFHWYFPDWMPHEVYILAAPVARYHEIGEIKWGDKPDDGSQNAEEKFEREYAVVKDFFRDIPDAEGYLPYIWELSEKMHGVPYEAVANANIAEQAAWWVKALDKAEAVLQNGRYKKLGVVGHIGQKDYASERDLRAVAELGTDDIALVWAYGSAGYLRDSPVWKLILAMLLDLYDEDEIPSQIWSPDI